MLYETMEMEESALNVANTLERKALSCFKRRRYDDAANHHARAADMLEMALTQAKNASVMPDIGKKREFHTIQAKVVIARKEQYTSLRKALELEKYVMRMLAAIGNKQEESVKLRLFNLLNTAESLINELANRKTLSDSDKDETDTSPSPSNHKDSKTLVQELHLSVVNLHALVIQIAGQLEESESKRQFLEHKISKLESFWKQTISSPSEPKNTLVTIKSPSPGKSSSEKNPQPSTSRRLPINPAIAPSTALSGKIEKAPLPKVIKAGIPGPENVCHFPNLADFVVSERPPLPPLPPLSPLDLSDVDLAKFTSSSSQVPLPTIIRKNSDDKASSDEREKRMKDKQDKTDRNDEENDEGNE